MITSSYSNTILLRKCSTPFLLLIMFVSLLTQCNNKKEKPVVTTTIPTTKPAPDTFPDNNLFRYSIIEPGILLDTTRMESKKTHTYLTIILPDYASDHSYVRREIEKAVKDKKESYYDEVRESAKESPPEENEMPHGWSLNLTPVLFYRDSSLLSYVFWDGMGYSASPYGYDFLAINFNNKTGKPIRFQDYFLFETSADTTAMAELICRSIDCGKAEEMQHRLQYDPISFGFDKDFVYFFFGRYDVFMGGSIGSARKEYIKKYIKPAYR